MLLAAVHGSRRPRRARSARSGRTGRRRRRRRSRASTTRTPRRCSTPRASARTPRACSAATRRRGRPRPTPAARSACCSRDTSACSSRQVVVRRSPSSRANRIAGLSSSRRSRFSAKLSGRVGEEPGAPQLVVIRTLDHTLAGIADDARSAPTPSARTAPAARPTTRAAPRTRRSRRPNARARPRRRRSGCSTRSAPRTAPTAVHGRSRLRTSAERLWPRSERPDQPFGRELPPRGGVTAGR